MARQKPSSDPVFDTLAGATEVLAPVLHDIGSTDREEPALLPVAPAPAPVAVPMKRYLVKLKFSPDAVVRASHPAEAFDKFKRRMNIRETVHTPDVREIDLAGEPIDPPKPQFAPAPPPPGPVEID